MKFAKPRYIPAILTVGLLMGLTVDTLSRPKPDDANSYHADVKDAVDQMETPEGWIYQDGELPPAAVKLLRDPTHLFRAFQTPRPFQFLLIQCRDARDMGGHYPPICYPASGWVALGDEKGQHMTWTFDDKVIVGREYQFTGTSEGQTITRIVDNLLILPRGAGQKCYVEDIDDVRDAAADYAQKIFGAAQIQLIFDGAIPENERRDIFTKLIGKNMKLLTVLEKQ